MRQGVPHYTYCGATDAPSRCRDLSLFVAYRSAPKLYSASQCSSRIQGRSCSPRVHRTILAVPTGGQGPNCCSILRHQVTALGLPAHREAVSASVSCGLTHKITCAMVPRMESYLGTIVEHTVTHPPKVNVLAHGCFQLWHVAASEIQLVENRLLCS